MEKEKISEFNLPTYREIPNVGLYLDQVSKYINECFAEGSDFSITNSMISNYVKHHIIANPVKKLYYRDQIAQLIFITLSKGAVPLESLKDLLDRQAAICEAEKAYSYFADTFNKRLHDIFHNEAEDYIREENDRKHVVNNIVSTVVHQIYLNARIGEFMTESENTI